MRKSTLIATAIITTSVLANVVFNAAHAADKLKSDLDSGFGVAVVAQTSSQSTSASPGVNLFARKIFKHGQLAATATKYDVQSKNTDANDTRMTLLWTGLLNISYPLEAAPIVGYHVGFSDRLSLTQTQTVKDAVYAGVSVGYLFSRHTYANIGYSVGAGTVTTQNGDYSNPIPNIAIGSTKTDKNQRIDIASAALVHQLDNDLAVRIGVTYVRDEVNFDNLETTVSLSKNF